MTNEQLKSLEDALFRITFAILAAIFLAISTWEVDLYSFEGVHWLLYLSFVPLIPTLLMNLGNLIAQLRTRSIYYAGAMLFLQAYILPDTIHLDGVRYVTVGGAIACATATVLFATVDLFDVWDNPDSLDIK